VGFENQTLLVEGIIIWLVGFSVATTLLLLSKRLQAHSEPYPYSSSTVLRYVAIAAFTSGILALDWQLLKFTLEPDVYVSVAGGRIYFERFLLPILASLASASLLAVYSGYENHTPYQEVLRKAFSRFHVPLVIAGIGIAISVPFFLMSGGRLLAFIVLGAGYLVFGLNSFHLDLYQARHSLARVASTLLIFLICYGISGWIFMSYFSLQGHALVWLLGNAILYLVLSGVVLEGKSSSS
jgi:hypothetical protein